MHRDLIIPCLLFLLLQSSRLLAEEANSSRIFKADDVTSVAECGCTLFQLQMSIPSHQHRDVTSSQCQQLDKVDARKWMQKSRQAEAEVVTLREQLKSQQELKLQVEVEVRREVAKDSADLVRLNEKLYQENLDLKHQITDTASCKAEVLREITRTNTDILDQLTSINISNNEIFDKIQRVVSRLDELEAGLKSLQISTSQQPSTCKPPCEKTDLNTTTLGGKQYYFSFDQPKMSWSDAKIFCRSHHMDLVSVDTGEEWRALQPEVEKLHVEMDSPWSSGTDSAQEGKWTWGSGCGFTFHASKMMYNVVDYDCMYLHPEWWGDWSCSDTRSFICEVNSDF